MNITSIMLGKEMVKVANGHVYPSATDDKLIMTVERLLEGAGFVKVAIRYHSVGMLTIGWLAVSRLYAVGITKNRGATKMVGIVWWDKVVQIEVNNTIVYDKRVR